MIGSVGLAIWAACGGGLLGTVVAHPFKACLLKQDSWDQEKRNLRLGTIAFIAGTTIFVACYNYLSDLPGLGFNHNVNYTLLAGYSFVLSFNATISLLVKEKRQELNPPEHSLV